MKNLTLLNRRVLWLSLISLIIGSLFLITYLIFENFAIAVAGFFYVIIAFTTNLIVFLWLLYNVLFEKKHINQTLKVMGIQLVNIPIAYAYFLIVIEII